MPMPLQIEHRRTAYITKPIDMPRKLAEKVDNVFSAGREAIPEDKGREEHRCELLQEDGDFHVEKKAEFRVDLGGKRIVC